MILPIVAYGDPVLKKRAVDIGKDYPNLESLIENMFETMYNANGVGIAAPQVGLGIRVFVVDGVGFAEEGDEDYEVLKDFKKVFINPEILDEEGDEWAFSEGCLSIPDIHEDVFRKPDLRIRYLDENFEEHEETYTGMPARIIQHEYDHIEGVLFTDRLSGLRKRLLKGKLSNISKGKIDVGYKMKFPLAK
ncbi:MAG: peptide deformylase [Bacteroidota bacterium]|nr:peptide deformylase [Bacteroidota bacterium]MDX5427606.1 peptide deformylase [Bacteroidota bacterium]MDX5448639.1 peptide deformylase [Bacteroidota bacterium]MDX5505511.1 peptide deformylase [Bacteroidota bacterium]